MTDSDFDPLVAVAQKRNADLGITGLSACNGRNFMQALEGETDNVLNMMAAISKDERHTGVVIIRQQEIAKRAFPDWSMRLTHIWRADQSSEWQRLAG